jgi:hypothetical protein
MNMRLLFTPASISKTRMPSASEHGLFLTIPPEGINIKSSNSFRSFKAALTRRRKAGPGLPSGKTAEPMMMAIIFSILLSLQNSLEF